MKSCVLPMRWIIILLTSLGTFLLAGLAININIALVAMVNNTAVLKAGLDINNTNDEVWRTLIMNEDGPFVWDDKMQGLILGAYFYGAFIGQLPAGWIATFFSPKLQFATMIILSALANLLTPVSALSVPALIFVRGFVGFLAGSNFPVVAEILSKWGPPKEKVAMSTVMYVGHAMAVIVFFPISGVIAKKVSWEALFYIEGVLTLIWIFPWMYYMYDTPMEHPRISASEKEFLKNEIGGNEAREIKVPLKKILTSGPVWALIITHMCTAWGCYLLLEKIPQFMHTMLGLDIQANAVLNAIPYTCMLIFAFAFAHTFEYLVNIKLITLLNARRTATFVSTVLPGICFIALGYVDYSTPTPAIALITTSATLIGAMYYAHIPNHEEIAPDLSGLLVAITSMFAIVSGMVLPNVVSAITDDNHTAEAWRTAFYISFGVQLFGFLAYTMLGSVEPQPWGIFAKQSST